MSDAGSSGVAVVVPAHDSEATVERALRSALGQTRPPDEIVVVDDGSTDATAATARAVGQGVRVVCQERGGPSAARNAGVAASSCGWIAFLDADDEWHREKIERQLRFAAGATVLVATDWARALVGAPAPAEVPTTRITTADILLLNRFQTSTVLLRRDAFEAAGRFDPALDGVEDWDMWLRSSRQGEVVKLDWPFVHYADVSSGYSKALERVYRTGRVMLERELGPSPDRHARAVLAWHHERFALAFLLDGDREMARVCMSECRDSGLGRAIPEAAARYVLPFLASRAQRRLRAWRR